MRLLEVIRDSWGFIGIEPVSVIELNPFGNALVEAADGRVWRLCPEELSCVVVADSRANLEALVATPEFQADWHMVPLVELAAAHLGPLPDGRCYCLKIPAVLGGAYEKANLGTNSVAELLSFSGDMAQQIKDLPDGATVDLEVVD